MKEQTTAPTDCTTIPTSNLKFKGPFHWDHLKQIKPFLNGKSGIYIWGYMCDLAQNNIKGTVNFKKTGVPFFPYNEPCGSLGINYKNKKWEFVPYYVGLDNNLNTKQIPFERIRTEHDVENPNYGAKFTRLFGQYYNSFFNDIDFPINTRKGSSWIVSNKSFNMKISKCVQYFNDMHILKKYIYPNDIIENNLHNSGKKNEINHNPITNIEKNGLLLNLKDSLKEIIIDKNNFWFCYAELDIVAQEELNKIEDKLVEEKKLTGERKKTTNFLEYPEAQTFYALKGKTISKTMTFNSINNSPFNTKYDINAEPTCKHIFKQNINCNIISLDKFDGYLKDDPYVI